MSDASAYRLTLFGLLIPVWLLARVSVTGRIIGLFYLTLFSIVFALTTGAVVLARAERLSIGVWFCALWPWATIGMFWFAARWERSCTDTCPIRPNNDLLPILIVCGLALLLPAILWAQAGWRQRGNVSSG